MWTGMSEGMATGKAFEGKARRDPTTPLHLPPSSLIHHHMVEEQEDEDEDDDDDC